MASQSDHHKVEDPKYCNACSKSVTRAKRTPEPVNIRLVGAAASANLHHVVIRKAMDAGHLDSVGWNAQDGVYDAALLCIHPPMPPHGHVHWRCKTARKSGAVHICAVSFIGL